VLNCGLVGRLKPVDLQYDAVLLAVYEVDEITDPNNCSHCQVFHRISVSAHSSLRMPFRLDLAECRRLWQIYHSLFSWLWRSHACRAVRF